MDFKFKLLFRDKEFKFFEFRFNLAEGATFYSNIHRSDIYAYNLHILLFNLFVKFVFVYKIYFFYSMGMN